MHRWQFLMIEGSDTFYLHATVPGKDSIKHSSIETFCIHSKVVLLYRSTVMLSLSTSYHLPGQVLLSLIHNISPSLTRWWAAYHLPETSWSGWPLSRPINNQSDKSDTAQLPFHALNQSRQIKRVNTDKNAWKMDKMEAPGVLKKTPFLELFTLDTQ